MHILTSLRWFARTLSLGGAIAAAITIILIVGVILTEIVLRTLFATSTFMSDELVGYMIAAVGFLPLGYAFAEGGVLRVNLLLNNIGDRPKLRTSVEMLCVVLTLAVVGLLAWYFWGNVARQFSRGYTSGTVSGIPQWIPTGVMLAGILIFWLQVFVYGLGLLVGDQRLLVEAQDETAVG